MTSKIFSAESFSESKMALQSIQETNRQVLVWNTFEWGGGGGRAPRNKPRYGVNYEGNEPVCSSTFWEDRVREGDFGVFLDCLPIRFRVEGVLRSFTSQEMVSPTNIFTWNQNSSSPQASVGGGRSPPCDGPRGSKD